MRKTGYLASVDNIPPLIFRFQFNPEVLSEKKIFKYNEDERGFGQWDFEQTRAAQGALATIAGLWKDIKDFGPLLTAIKPIRPVEGSARQFAMEFQLYASSSTELPDDPLFTRESIEPDLAVLRSFMNPSLGLMDLLDVFKGNICWQRPPECSLVYGDLSLTCVMTDLNIKIVAFNDEGQPIRADVNATLKEQSYSISTITDFITRYVNVIRSYDRAGGAEEFGQDLLNATGIQKIIDIFK
jgi:hypothetical protein